MCGFPILKLLRRSSNALQCCMSASLTCTRKKCYTIFYPAQVVLLLVAFSTHLATLGALSQRCFTLGVFVLYQSRLRILNHGHDRPALKPMGRQIFRRSRDNE